MTNTDLSQASLLHRQGRLAEAEQHYRAILARDPTHFDALYGLGVLSFQSGRGDDAVALLSAAVKARPDALDVLANYAAVLLHMRRFDDVVATCDRILAISPLSPDALLQRGVALQNLGRGADAIDSFRKALALRADFTPAALNLGAALARNGRYDEALAIFDGLLARFPGEPDLLNNRGNVLLALNRHQDALAAFERALATKPDHILALGNRGIALKGLQRHAEALAAFDKVLAMVPNHVEAIVNRGNLLLEMERAADALACYARALTLAPNEPTILRNHGLALVTLHRGAEACASLDKAIAIRPDYAEAWYSRGGALQLLNRNRDAVASFERALALKPDYDEAKFAICKAELPAVYMDEPEVGVQRAAYERRLRALADECAQRPSLAALAPMVGLHQPFALPYQGRNDRDLQRLYGSLMGRIMAERYPPAPMPSPPAPGEPVKVGIVSAFFWAHSNWKIPIKGWLSQLDRQRFRLFGYHTGTRRDSETAVAAALCERFVQDQLSTDRWRETILADAPHVLIYPEIGMDPLSARLAAQRLAPVQCTSWGHPITSGFPTLDYFLSSDAMEPSGADEHYTEELVRLPNLSIYYEPLAVEPAALTRTDFGLRADAVVYWCGQALIKYLPQYDQVFARIARDVPGCQFVFIDSADAQINAVFLERLTRAFAALGLDAAGRCVMLPIMEAPRFLASIGASDVVLDSIGWSGCNSTIETLHADMPIVTMPGELMRGRHTTAILEMIGATETIAASIDDYVAIAVRLARDPAWRTSIKEQIAANKHRLYRDRSPVDALEIFLDRVARSCA